MKLLRVADPLRAGIAGPLKGEPPRNPEGLGGFHDNPPNHVLVARRKSQFKPGNNINPYGCRGFKAFGVRKVKTTKRTPEQLKATLDFREIQEMARKSVPDAIRELTRIIGDEQSSDMAKIAAYHALADRGYGKSTQTNINANIDPDAKPSTVNAAELDARIAEALQRIERITGRAREKIESPQQSSDIRKYN